MTVMYMKSHWTKSERLVEIAERFCELVESGPRLRCTNEAEALRLVVYSLEA